MKKVLFLFVFLFSVLGAAAKNLQQVVFKVEQMTCVNCEAKVKRNIPYEKGVKNMKTDVENHTVTVTFDADVTNVPNPIRSSRASTSRPPIVTPTKRALPSSATRPRCSNPPLLSTRSKNKPRCRLPPPAPPGSLRGGAFFLHGGTCAVVVDPLS